MEVTETEPLDGSLLQWVKSFESAGRVDRLQDLNAGQALWAILQEVDADYFTGGLPEPTVDADGEWTRKWQNLKHIEKQLSVYYRDVCTGQDDLATSAAPDLKAIAADSSERDLGKLIMMIIRSAMASPNSNQRMAQRLMSLGRDNAMIIANELRNMEESDDAESEPASRDESAYQSEQEMPAEPKRNGGKSNQGMYGDELLEREEELLQAQDTINKLQASQAVAQRQMEELRAEKERLKEAFDAYRSEIDVKGRKIVADDSYRKLQRQAENDRSYIDELENQLQSSRSTTESYERQIERHKGEHEASQKLRDDLQALRADNEDLNQKIKANENLKKKIHALQEHEKANSQLRDELKQANDRLEEFERLKSVQAGLEKEIIEKKGLIRNQEYQINELTTTRKHAEYDARVLAQKLEAARQRHDQDHEAIGDLRSKLQEANTETAHVDETPQEQDKQLEESKPERMASVSNTDESKHLAEKLALVEQQLEAVDARLKQASQRNATLEEQNRDLEDALSARQAAEQQGLESEKTIADLRKQLESSPQQQKGTPTQDMATLQRENYLMASAWHDLSSRLQSNGVSVGRRRLEPKSWIGKQRGLVGPDSSFVSPFPVSLYAVTNDFAA